MGLCPLPARNAVCTGHSLHDRAILGFNVKITSPNLPIKLTFEEEWHVYPEAPNTSGRQAGSLIRVFCFLLKERQRGRGRGRERESPGTLRPCSPGAPPRHLDPPWGWLGSGAPHPTVPAHRLKVPCLFSPVTVPGPAQHLAYKVTGCEGPVYSRTS